MVPIRVFDSRRDRNSALRWLVAALVVVTAAYLVVGQYAPILADPAALRTWVAGFGVLAPLVFIAVQALQVVVAPVPAQVFVLVGGFLFGPVTGTVYSLVGAAIGTAVAFWLSRRYGRQYVERVVSPATLARFDAFTEHHALGGFFLAFLLPGLPDDVFCFLAGLTEIRLWQLLAVSLLGRVPSYVFVTFVGTELARENLDVALALAAVLLVVGVVAYSYRRRILAAVSSYRLG